MDFQYTAAGSSLNIKPYNKKLKERMDKNTKIQFIRYQSYPLILIPFSRPPPLLSPPKSRPEPDLNIASRAICRRCL